MQKNDKWRVKNKKMTAIVIICLIIGIGERTLLGYITNEILKNKGYSENWFWWGFLFGIWAILFAFIKPDLTRTYSDNQVNTFLHDYAEEEYNRRNNVSGEKSQNINDIKIIDNGGWKCSCGRINASYVGTCGCGRLKSEVDKKVKEQEGADSVNACAETTPKLEKENEIKNLEYIVKLKELLDAGVITQEEFEAKKKKLLDI